MAKYEILVGSTDQTIDIKIESSVTSQGLTGLVYNTSGLTCYYRKGATGSATQLTLVTQTVGGAHSDGGFVEISSANMPGLYRLDLSDAMVDAVGPLKVYLRGAANMLECVAEIDVTANMDKTDSRFRRAVNGIVYGTVDTGASSTSIPCSAIDPAPTSSNQFKNKVLIFERATSTTGLRCAPTTVTANTTGATPTLTVSPALPATPASGDIFTLE